MGNSTRRTTPPTTRLSLNAKPYVSLITGQPRTPMNSPLINAPNEPWNEATWLRPEKLDAQLDEVN